MVYKLGRLDSSLMSGVLLLLLGVTFILVLCLMILLLKYIIHMTTKKAQMELMRFCQCAILAMWTSDAAIKIRQQMIPKDYQKITRW